jgi:hypothetical protein
MTMLVILYKYWLVLRGKDESRSNKLQVFFTIELLLNYEYEVPDNIYRA